MGALQIKSSVYFISVPGTRAEIQKSSSRAPQDFLFTRLACYCPAVCTLYLFTSATTKQGEQDAVKPGHKKGLIHI